MTTADAGPTWSDIATWYDALVRAGSGPHETAVDCLLRLVPPLIDAEVLDLACGQGLATRALAGAGVRRVVGVDSSAAMLELARRHVRPPAANVAYVRDDAQRLAAVDDGSIDGVTCQLGLMDIPDLDATLSSVHRVLRPRGWFVFVIGHPCFLAPGPTWPWSWPRSRSPGRVSPRSGPCTARCRSSSPLAPASPCSDPRAGAT